MPLVQQLLIVMFCWFYIHRLRINGCGIFDVLSFDASNSPNAMIPHFQVNLLDDSREIKHGVIRQTRACLSFCYLFY